MNRFRKNTNSQVSIGMVQPFFIAVYTELVSAKGNRCGFPCRAVARIGARGTVAPISDKFKSVSLFAVMPNGPAFRTLVQWLDRKSSEKCEMTTWPGILSFQMPRQNGAAETFVSPLCVKVPPYIVDKELVSNSCLNYSFSLLYVAVE